MFKPRGISKGTSADNLFPALLEVLIDLVHECLSAEVVLILLDVVAMNADSKILGHMAALNGVNDRFLEGGRELGKELVVVKLCTVGETTGPCEDRGHGVGGGGLTLLPLSVVAGDSAVSSLSLNHVVLVQ